MLPEIWGKHAWNFLHLVTLAYPENPSEEDKNNYYNFFYSIKNILPCEKCCYNMKCHLKKYPLTRQVLSSRNTLVKWCIDLHNIVNYYTGKSMMPYDQCMQELNKLTNPEIKYNNYFYYSVIIISIAIIAYVAYINYFAEKK
jgi:hypothetical protein